MITDATEARFVMYLHIKMTRLLLPLLLSVAAASAQVKITADDKLVHVRINGRPYADFVVKSDDAMKPYLYPLRAASGTIVTRHWPMEKVSAVEPVDHQHQRGVWFGPDLVNGFDFWNNEVSYKIPISGLIKLNRIGALKSGKKQGSIAASFDWMNPKGITIVEESRLMTFYVLPALRIIDFEIDLTAIDRVKFGDGKDCCFGIRIAPQLQEDKVIKVKGQPDVTIPGPPGVIANSEGKTTEKLVWGKPADWCDYSGAIDGEKLGIAIFDHPKNPHRARWHVRGYGLFAANPFGLAAFTGDKSQDGSVLLEPGEKLHFKYRVVIHPGNADIAKLWAEYAK
jgi:methane monooxygenase PmoA-like